MFGKKYYINLETLRYERVKLTQKQRIRYLGLFSFGLISIAILMRFGFERIYPTPRQIIYEQENNTLRAEYAALNSELKEVEAQLADLQNRDDRFYRAILSLDPIPNSIRGVGTGGALRDQHLRNLREPGMVLDVSQRIDKISNKVRIQNSSLNAILEEAVEKQHFLACRPSINPISPADPYWLTSSYGYRNDPFTGQRTAHHGIDLAGPTGLDIHSSGAGTVVFAKMSLYGYGKEVLIDHGYGYTSRYAHLDDIFVKPGQELKRGEVIGTLGCTGRSTGPHLHYEIRKDGRAVNPTYFFYENLSRDEYSLLASNAGAPDNAYHSLALSQK
ncbi:MAG: M23 family metallopeptidase [Bacteroidales bacterium]|nr:M23 family metallopeptidase [Bacteroidales bacterium]